MKASLFERSVYSSSRSVIPSNVVSQVVSGMQKSRLQDSFGNCSLRPTSRHEQKRFYRPAGRNTWALTHHRIRQPRKLVDRFHPLKFHQHKEWWRERRICPATFMGFPDVSKIDIRGGSLYTEQMDAVTLAVIAEKCINEGIKSDEIWKKFTWRSQQLATKMKEPDLCYLFRSFARADKFDKTWFATYVGRIYRRMPWLTVGNCMTIFQGICVNDKFRYKPLVDALTGQLTELLHARDDISLEDLTQCALYMHEFGNYYVLELALDHLAGRDLTALEAIDQVALLELVGDMTANPKEVQEDTAIAELKLGLLMAFDGGNQIEEAKPAECVQLCRALVMLKQNARTHSKADVLANHTVGQLLVRMKIQVKKIAYQMTSAGVTECAFLLNALDMSPMLSPRCKQMKNLDLARYAHIVATDADFETLRKILAQRIQDFKPEELSVLYRAFVIDNIEDIIRNQAVEMQEIEGSVGASGVSSSSSEESESEPNIALQEATENLDDAVTSFNSYLGLHTALNSNLNIVMNGDGNSLLGRKLIPVIDMDQLVDGINVAEESLLSSENASDNLLAHEIANATEGEQLLVVPKEDLLLRVIQKKILLNLDNFELEHLTPILRHMQYVPVVNAVDNDSFVRKLSEKATQLLMQKNEDLLLEEQKLWSSDTNQQTMQMENKDDQQLQMNGSGGSDLQAQWNEGSIAVKQTQSGREYLDHPSSISGRDHWRATTSPIITDAIADILESPTSKVSNGLCEMIHSRSVDLPAAKSMDVLIQLIGKRFETTVKLVESDGKQKTDETILKLFSEQGPLKDQPIENLTAFANCIAKVRMSKACSDGVAELQSRFTNVALIDELYRAVDMRRYDRGEKYEKHVVTKALEVVKLLKAQARTLEN